MIHTIKKAITVFSLVVFGGALVYNCEPDADTLGEQLFLDGAAQGNERSFDVTAFNINNNDSIRSDASKLTYGVLGAFNEEQFGMQKASYLTQLRLSTYSPDFGTNASVDSVVLVLKPRFASDSVKTNTVDDNYTYTTFADGTVNAKKVVNTYPVLKFGKAKRTFNIKVNEVDEFLKGVSDSAKSNSTYSATTLLGSKEFKGSVSSVAITKDDGGAALFTAATPGIRIPLDKTFFQNKIIAKKGQPELQDASNFTRYFKGLRISVDENDGYLFQFSPNDMELIMYYKYDKTDVTPATRPQATYAFALGAGNTHIGQYQYDRSSSVLKDAVMGNVNGGAPKLFAQGMGGPSIGIKFPKNTIDTLKKRYNVNKAAIISAKVRLYIDKSSWNNSYARPTAFTLLQRSLSTNPQPNHTISLAFTKDLTSFANLPGFRFYNYNLTNDPPYYDFIVTQSIKDIVEAKDDTVNNDDPNRFLRIDIGTFLSNSQTNALIGPSSTSRAYDTQRAVFVGSNTVNPLDPNRAQLLVVYGTK